MKIKFIHVVVFILICLAFAFLLAGVGGSINTCDPTISTCGTGP